MPDEDFLEQATRGQKAPAWCRGLSRCRTMKARTEWFRDRLEIFAEHWTQSIAGIGNAAHLGRISPEAFTRIGYFRPNGCDAMFWAIDPTITLLNYQIMGPKYRSLTRWFVGEPLTPAEFFGEHVWPLHKDRMNSEQLAELEHALTTHPGLEVEVLR
jgi:hypothetical protein